MACHHERNCLFCGDKYQPDARNKRHQKYCSKPACRKASKAASHRAWLAKPENQNYFRSRENVARVQEWRATHPDYWRRSKEHGEVTSEEPIALQDVCTNEMVDIIEIPEPPKDVLKPALQDILMGNQQNQQAVLIGFIAHFMGSALQEDIEKSAHHLLKLGYDILAGRIGDDHKTHSLFGLNSANSGPVHLGRPSPCSQAL